MPYAFALRAERRYLGLLAPIVQYLQKKLFPFNYVIPGQSINSIFHFKRYCQAHDHLKTYLADMQAGADEDYTPSDNVFSADNRRMVWISLVEDSLRQSLERHGHFEAGRIDAIQSGLHSEGLPLLEEETPYRLGKLPPPILLIPFQHARSGVGLARGLRS